jgi:hypothetical protein
MTPERASMTKSFLGEPFGHDRFVSYSHAAFAGNHDPDLKLWSHKFARGPAR